MADRILTETGNSTAPDYDQMRGVAPQFAAWAGPMGEAMTNFLYGDPNQNPYYGDPSLWPKAGVVAFVDRPLNFLGVGAGVTKGPTPLNFGGGQNVIVFSRVATVVPVTPGVDGNNSVVLPNQLPGYVTVKQEQANGLVEIEETSILNTFGFGWQPYVLPTPEMWVGNVERLFYLANNSVVPVNVMLSWKIAFLNTGR